LADLEYSNEALNARGAFLGVKVVVYVEGDDDVLFWNEIFSAVTNSDFEVESVGGSDRLDRLAKMIADGELRAIVARDADFDVVFGRAFFDPRVLYTFGYSIENSLYVSDALLRLTQSWCKSHHVSLAECEEWLSHLAEHIRELVRLDAANRFCEAGLVTIGDNCTRFMTGHKSSTFCRNKIGAHVTAVAGVIPPTLLADIDRRLGLGLGRDGILRHVRGHFLSSAVARFIGSKARSFGKPVGVSTDALYAAAIQRFSTLLHKGHPHREHYLSAALAAWAAI